MQCKERQDVTIVDGKLLKLFVLCLLAICDVSSLLIYDRSTLLRIQNPLNVSDFGKIGHSNTPPPFLTGLTPSTLLRNKRCRRQGRRAGVFVKFKFCSLIARMIMALYCTIYLLSCQLPTCRPAGIDKQGPVPQNLLWLVQAADDTAGCVPVRTAMFNTQSLTNKNVMLSDLISTHHLFLLTETWLKPGDNSTFSELLPPDYSHLNAPGVSGHGGGFAMFFSDKLSCRLLPRKNYSSFELQLFVMESEQNPEEFITFFQYSSTKIMDSIAPLTRPSTKLNQILGLMMLVFSRK